VACLSYGTFAQDTQSTAQPGQEGPEPTNQCVCSELKQCMQDQMAEMHSHMEELHKCIDGCHQSANGSGNSAVHDCWQLAHSSMPHNCMESVTNEMCTDQSGVNLSPGDVLSGGIPALFSTYGSPSGGNGNPSGGNGESQPPAGGVPPVPAGGPSTTDQQPADPQANCFQQCHQQHGGEQPHPHPHAGEGQGGPHHGGPGGGKCCAHKLHCALKKPDPHTAQQVVPQCQQQWQQHKQQLCQCLSQANAGHMPPMCRAQQYP